MLEQTEVTIDKEIDARGSFCPGPLMELIRGMKALPVGGVLAEPTRLKLLSLLGERSRTVKSLVKATGERQEKISQHLTIMRWRWHRAHPTQRDGGPLPTR
jgi:DNA-binding transcriptional ArsR family regulator